MHICLLDIDGTLLLTGGAGQAAFSQTLVEEFGIRKIVTPVAFAGRSDRAIALELLETHGLEPSVANWHRFCAGYLHRLDAALAAYQGYVLPGAAELLTALANRGDVALGLVTGNVREGARRKLTHYGLWHWFAFGGFGDDHVERCHIAADALAAAREHLNGHARHSSNGSVNHGQIVVIGDTPHDIDAARSIGARCVAVPTGHSTADDLQRSRPDLLVETLEEVGSIVALFDRAG
jgi:phosphoglycolate phosphatase-like HAD superfamily hydrolase